jgi:hypothetical protein
MMSIPECASLFYGQRRDPCRHKRVEPIMTAFRDGRLERGLKTLRLPSSPLRDSLQLGTKATPLR